MDFTVNIWGHTALTCVLNVPCLAQLLHMNIPHSFSPPFKIYFYFSNATTNVSLDTSDQVMKPFFYLLWAKVGWMYHRSKMRNHKAKCKLNNVNYFDCFLFCVFCFLRRFSLRHRRELPGDTLMKSQWKKWPLLQN